MQSMRPKKNLAEFIAAGDRAWYRKERVLYGSRTLGRKPRKDLRIKLAQLPIHPMFEPEWHADFLDLSVDESYELRD